MFPNRGLFIKRCTLKPVKNISQESLYSGTSISRYGQLGDKKIISSNRDIVVNELSIKQFEYRNMAYSTIFQLQSIKSISFRNMTPALQVFYLQYLQCANELQKQLPKQNTMSIHILCSVCQVLANLQFTVCDIAVTGKSLWLGRQISIIVPGISLNRILLNRYFALFNLL